MAQDEMGLGRTIKSLGPTHGEREWAMTPGGTSHRGSRVYGILQ